VTDTATEAPAAETRLPCLCGCGETPKGKKARFMPGHDAQLKASLYRTIRDPEAPADAKAAASEKLSEFGWPQPTEKPARKSRAKNKDKDEPATDGPVEAADL
jgi:hypothetical protein